MLHDSLRRFGLKTIFWLPGFVALMLIAGCGEGSGTSEDPATGEGPEQPVLSEDERREKDLAYQRELAEIELEKERQKLQMQLDMEIEKKRRENEVEQEQEDAKGLAIISAVNASYRRSLAQEGTWVLQLYNPNTVQVSFDLLCRNTSGRQETYLVTLGPGGELEIGFLQLWGDNFRKDDYAEAYYKDQLAWRATCP